MVPQLNRPPSPSSVDGDENLGVTAEQQQLLARLGQTAQRSTISGSDVFDAAVLLNKSILQDAFISTVYRFVPPKDQAIYAARLLPLSSSSHAAALLINNILKDPSHFTDPDVEQFVKTNPVARKNSLLTVDDNAVLWAIMTSQYAADALGRIAARHPYTLVNFSRKTIARRSRVARSAAYTRVGARRQFCKA
jgi:hypothetical protein